MSWPWSQLGLPGPSDPSQVRHAYAEKLKLTHPEDDPEGFQRLHSAYQLASRMACQNRRQAAPPPTPPPAGEKKQDFRSDEPPRGETERPRLSRGEDREQDFDFDELLQGETERPRLSHGEDREQDFDFDELLQEERGSFHPRQEETEQDWDYERLFAEGEAERAEARRRRGEERRKAQERERQARFHKEQELRSDYERVRRERFDQEQLRWQNTEAILHTIEMMVIAQADQGAWAKFFKSPLFHQMKDSLDLLFGLEDLAGARQDFSHQARISLFLAYGFDKGVSRPEQRPLYQLLLPAWEEKQNEKRRQRMHKLFVGAGTVAGVIILAIILSSNYLPVFISLGALAVYGLTRSWFKREPKSLNGRRRTNWYRVSFVTGIIIALAIMLFQLPEMWNEAEMMVSDPRERVCRYLEQDYGEEFLSLYNESSQDVWFSNVFYPKSNSHRMFLAGPDGDRKNGNPGYTTNYPEMMLLWALKEFARSNDLYAADSASGSQELWETSGTVLIALPFYGAGETIIQLGELLEELSLEDWYQVRSPELEIVLCSGPLKDGRLVLCRHKSGDAFDAEAMRTLYEESFAHAYCAGLLRDEDLDRDFVHGGEERYTLTDAGMAELKGETHCKLYGLDGEGRVMMEYYVSGTGGSVLCVPGDFWEKGGKEEDIQFYRLVHKEATEELLTVYYPWITVY